MQRSLKKKETEVNRGLSFQFLGFGTRVRGRNLIIRAVLFISCALLGFLVVSQYESLRKTPEEKFIEGKSAEELSNDYIILYNKNTALLLRNSQLTNSISDLEDARNGDAELQSILKNEVMAAQRKAGFLEVSGNGINVVITPDQEAPITSNMLIQLVNEMKAADALAISINGQRIVPVTEIRDTVSGFSVNGEMFSYGNPITILALGKGVDMYSALQMVGGVLDKWAQSHVDVYVDIKEDLTIPALGEKQREEMSLLYYYLAPPTPTPE